MRKQILKMVLLFLLGLGCLGLFSLHPKTVLAANPTTINFQGKVVNSDGTNVTNGSYTFIFRLYDNSSPTLTGTCSGNAQCWWEETDSITVTNGVFQVELGTGCALSSACSSSHSGIDFNTNNALYLTMKFNSDAAGYMSPLVHLTSVPYALNSDALGGLAAGNFVQLAQGIQTDSSTTNASIGINKTGGTANILTLQKSGKNVLVVNNGGTTLLGQAGASGLDGTLTFNNSAGSNTVSFSLQANPGSSYTLLLPTTGPSTSQCLQTDGTTATQLVFASCSGGSQPFTITTGTIAQTTSTDQVNLVEGQAGDYGLKVSTSVAPTVDLVQIINANASTTDNIAGLHLSFTSSSASDDALRITPSFTSTTTGKTFQVLNIEAFTATNSTGTDTVSGLVLGNLTESGAGAITSTALNVGSGWDTVLSVNGTSVVGSTGLINTSTSIVSGSYTGITGTGALDAGSITSNFGSINIGTDTLASGAITTSGTLTFSSVSADITTGTDQDLTLASNGTGDLVFSIDADSVASFTALAPPGVDMVTITNSGQVSTTDNVDGVLVNFSTSNASGDALHIIPGFTANGSDTYSGIEIDALSMGSSSGSNTVNGFKIGNLTESGTITSTALNIGTGWDTGLSLGSGNVVSTGTVDISVTPGGNLLISDGDGTGATYVVRIGTSSDNMSFGAGFEPTLNGSARHTRVVNLSPEFPGATMTADGATNSGTMTSDFCGNDGGGSFTDIGTGVCNTSGDFHDYYSWTSNGANDYDVFVRYKVPSDFSAFSASNPIGFYSKKSASGDDVKLTIYTNAGAVCGTGTSMTNTTVTWLSTNYTSSGCSPSAGDILTLDAHMAVAANGNTVQMGEISISYLSKW
jgi:hypothetical protein